MTQLLDLTLQVNTETWVMEKKAENEPEALKWVWRPENIDDTVVKGKGEKTVCKLIDQKVANDVSDYLWVKIVEHDPIWSDDMRLRVNCTGQVLHAYVNGDYLVEIIGRKGNQRVIKDLSSHKWSYKAGLNSIDRYNKLLNINSSEWQSNKLPTQRKMTWYKMTFKAPLGTDSVSLDLEGLGKGHAWVNRKSIGRYWPSNIARDSNCTEKACDYRGKYYFTKCVRHCGIPTQKWYHVPRSFLIDGENELVLFEEFGGNPSLVNFQTVAVGRTCGNAYENKTMKCIGKEKCAVLADEAVFGSTNCRGIKKRLVAEAVC
ncbi:hypothetical protein L1987_50203 [Smallanthus sonchifolius]|uniref:Uncharacterized protein n=1 Tax=Smallanthus sonchifolius TaxID=185202 RepID=A0ACB9FWK5_9ASTR|nr:hypothetical protein L1987_50203 [Smallanthus sonchifolius]